MIDAIRVHGDAKITQATALLMLCGNGGFPSKHTSD